MSENTFVQKYLVKDTQGNIYGPADSGMLRQWVLEGRIVAGMWIAEQETRAWMESSQHPAVADMLQVSPAAVTGPPEEPPAPAPSLPADPGSGPIELLDPAPRPAPRTGLVGLGAVGESRGGIGSARPAILDLAPATRMNPLGLISFICSLAGLVLSCGVCLPIISCIALPAGVLLQIAGATTGGIALYQLRTTPGEYHGQGIALAGTIISGGMLVLYGLLMIGVLFFGVMHKTP
jgi:hypothetical protein